MLSKSWMWSVVSLLLAACQSGSQASIKQSADVIVSYASAKREYANALARAIGIGEGTAYRLVPVIGPEWQIGDIVDIDNPVNILSYACRFARESIPASTSWSALPELTSLHSSVRTDAALPSEFLDALQKVGGKAGFNVLADATGRYSLSDLAGPIVAQQDFENALEAEPCRRARVSPSLIVRGVISGIETLGSEKKVSIGAGIKVFETDALVAQYDRSRNFALADKVARPKFYLLTMDSKGARGSATGTGLQRPPSDVVLRLESQHLVGER